MPGLPALTIALVVLAALAGLTYCTFWTWARTGPGINNRTAVAATLPVACFLVALCAWLSHFTGGIASRSLFVLLIGLICGYSVWTNHTIASFWVEASRQQEAIMGDLQKAIPRPPNGASILLDGFCAWTGPGIVFEIDWDTTGALGIAYQDRTISGDVLTPRMALTERAVVNRWNQPLYRYGALYFYNVGRKQAVKIENRDAAFRYQRESASDPQNRCIADESQFGFGSRIW